MKKNLGLILAMVTATAALAADPVAPPLNPPPGGTTAPATPPAISDPAPLTNSVTSTNKPAKKTTAKKDTTKKDTSAKKPAAKKPAKPMDFPLASPLVLNEPASTVHSNVNIRAQSHINSEVIGKLNPGDTVMVLDEVVLKTPKTDEPARWARISLPPGTHVWINTAFIDTTNSVVKASKLNVRSGPGQNYTVIGMVYQGDAVKALETKGEWTAIAAPTNAFGFVAAHMLKHMEPVLVAQVNPQPVVAPNPTEPEKTPTPTPTTPDATPAIPTPAPMPVAPEPPPKRIVQREGVVGGTVSIQAPTYFELFNLDNGKPMDYLFSTSTNLMLQKYKGRTVLVSGEEELDERWPNTPVLTIQRIQVVQ
jgi:hypothetical protein